jgi:hypothetical protein
MSHRRSRPTDRTRPGEDIFSLAALSLSSISAISARDRGVKVAGHVGRVFSIGELDHRLDWSLSLDRLPPETTAFPSDQCFSISISLLGSGVRAAKRRPQKPISQFPNPAWVRPVLFFRLIFVDKAAGCRGLDRTWAQLCSDIDLKSHNQEAT